MLRVLRAIIYIPGGLEASRWLLLCMEYIHRCQYTPVAVVRNGDWPSAQRMRDDGQADLIVVARRDHLPADRLPREEVVEEEGPALTPQQRRPRLIRRDEVAGP